MRGLLFAIALALVPLPALAQSALSADPDLQQQIRQRKIIVQPRPSPDVIQRDADQAIDELAAKRRLDDTVRDLNRPMPRRPDLTEPVDGAIQTRELNKALPR